MALGWVVLELTGSAFSVGVAAAASTLPILLFTLYGGGIADQLDKRRALILLQSLMAGDALTLAILTVTGHLSFTWIVVLAFAHGTFSAFEIPIRQSFLLDLVGRKDLMHGIALNSMGFSISRVLGPAIAGVLVATFGAAICFFINTVSFGAVISGLVRMTPESVTDRSPHQRPTLWDVHRYVQTTPWPKTLLSLALSTTLFAYSITAMIPVLAREVFQTGAKGYGGLMTAIGLGAALGAALIASLGHRVRRGNIAIASAIVIGVLHLVLVAFPGYALAVALLAGSGAMGAVAAIATNTMLQHEAPDALRSRIIGVYATIVVGLAPVGALGMGWLADRVGVGIAIGMGGALTSLIAGVLWWQRPRTLVSPVAKLLAGTVED